MPLTDDVAATRKVVLALTQATKALHRHYGDSVDARRLAADVARLSDDLDLLCGPEPSEPPPPAPKRMVIDDSQYEHDFWMDAEDEGLGSSYRSS